MASEARVRLLAEIASSKTAVIPVARLAVKLGTDQETAWRLAGEAERDGEVERWVNAPDGASVVLTPLSAERLKLRLCPESAKWVDDWPTTVRVGGVRAYRQRSASLD